MEHQPDSTSTLHSSSPGNWAPITPWSPSAATPVPSTSKVTSSRPPSGSATVGWAAAAGLGLALNPTVFSFVVMGALFGLVIGVLPGLSGHFAMAMTVTFLYTMDPAPGIAFLLAAHATVAQGGGLTAILFSTPGTGQNAATLLDGPPMRDNGEAGIAVGAAMTGLRRCSRA